MVNSRVHLKTRRRKPKFRQHVKPKTRTRMSVAVKYSQPVPMTPRSEPNTENTNNSPLLGQLSCVRCSKKLLDYEVFRPSNCEHNFCSECLQLSGNAGIYHCSSCSTEMFWFQQAVTGNRFFLGDFDPLRATLVETVNHSVELVREFQENIITNFQSVQGHNTEMLTRLYICLKSIQSSVIWDDLQLFKIEVTEDDASVMVDLYTALHELSGCEFEDDTGAEKHCIIDDMTDNIPYLIWLRSHLLRLERFLDPCVLSAEVMALWLTPVQGIL